MDALNHNSSSTANIDRTMTSLVSMMEDLSLKYSELCAENSLMRQQLENHLLQQSPRRKRTPLSPRKRARIGGSSDDTVTGGTGGDNDNVGAVNDSAVNDSTVDDGDIVGGAVGGGGVDGGGVNGGSNLQ